MTYRVELEPGAQDDIRELLDRARLTPAGGPPVEPDRAVAAAALDLIVALEQDPYLGEQLRARPRFESLEGCRRIRFDRPDWTERPRFRLVYRNEPSDGAVGTVVILAVATRARLDAYARARARLASRLRRL